VKDIFCFRIKRTVDAYRKISLRNVQVRIKNARPRQEVTVRIYLQNDGIAELRVWDGDTLLDVQRVKTDDLKLVHF
jgi:hypothetical protein